MFTGSHPKRFGSGSDKMIRILRIRIRHTNVLDLRTFKCGTGSRSASSSIWIRFQGINKKRENFSANLSSVVANLEKFEKNNKTFYILIKILAPSSVQAPGFFWVFSSWIRIHKVTPKSDPCISGSETPRHICVNIFLWISLWKCFFNKVIDNFVDTIAGPNYLRYLLVFEDSTIGISTANFRY